MKLYHGTNVDIETIDLSRCQPHKDFGRGFYLTDILKQAEYMAIRRCSQSGLGQRIIMVYDFDESLLKRRRLNIRHFAKPTKSWAQFILDNRLDENFSHPYDLVIGPIADDGVAYQLRRYEQNMISLAQLVRELTYRKLNRQYCFTTQDAVDQLVKTDVIILDNETSRNK